jgi:hypothetical protein
MNTSMRRFGPMAIGKLSELSRELQNLSDYKLTSNGNGEYVGSILGFVKGLRISAKLIYFIRHTLSNHSCEVDWGHIIDISSGACSPECDVIIHNPGFFERWNGGGDKPVMDFLFVESKHVKAVVSCKSKLTTIDEAYPKLMAEHGITKVFLFAECCSRSNYENLKSQAILAGYVGVWCAYFTTGQEGAIEEDENHYVDFWTTLRSLFENPPVNSIP